MTGIYFPNIDPVAIHLGAFGIRWYSIAYLLGILFSWTLTKKMVTRYPMDIKAEHIDDACFWMTIGMILGGRFGYVFFYNYNFYMEHPSQILAVWHGGMSFHGGMIGVILAMLFYSHKIKVRFLELSDLMVCVVPIGLFFGRIANFINAELFGRITTSVPWAIIFPNGGPLPRHPSQLYEAIFEGLFLFILLFTIWTRCVSVRVKHGLTSGLFLTGYSLARIMLENFREPDAQIGFLFARITMGQVLTIPMLIMGLILIIYGLKKV